MKDDEKKNSLLLPRVLAIIFILFISLFALDVFQPGELIPYMIAGFFIHLIPSYILLAILIISWKYELFGAVFILLGIFYIFWMRGFPPIVYLIISGPVFLVGILFLVNWTLKGEDKGGQAVSK